MFNFPDLDSEFLTSSSHPPFFPAGGDNYERYASWYATGYPNELEHYSVKAANWNETWKKQRRNEYVCAMATQLERGHLRHRLFASFEEVRYTQ